MDKEHETLRLRRKVFFTIASESNEYEMDIIPTSEFLEKLKQKGVDVFTFIERKWCFTLPNPPRSWLRTRDKIALLQIATYDAWLKSIGKKTRNMIRKAGKNGIRTEIAEPNRKLAEGIRKIYNETPIRQERGFLHYGTSLQAVETNMLLTKNSTYVVAYRQDELVGFIRLIHGDNITFIDQILSLQKYWDKAVNNALVAEAVQFCAHKGIRWLMYGRMGNHPTLDDFKKNNGFIQFLLTRYYVILTTKGRVVSMLGLHHDFKDALPQAAKRPLIPIYNWISRTKMLIRLKTRPKPIT
jgi:hypothetical protein